MTDPASTAVEGPLGGPGYTVEEALEHIGFGRTQIIMFLFVGVAWAGDGMEMMLLSYLGPEVRPPPVRVHAAQTGARTQENTFTDCYAAEMQVGLVPSAGELDYQCSVHWNDDWVVQLGCHFRQIRQKDRIFCAGRLHSWVWPSQCHSPHIRSMNPPP